MSCRALYENEFSAKALFAAGLAIMPALLFNPSTEYRVIQFLFYLLLALLSGKKIDLPAVLFITLFIVVFNLIIPYGRIIFSIGAFKVTSGSLEAGIYRAVTLQALVMLSKVTVRGDLKLPGSFGQLLGESLQVFTALTSRKIRITGNDFIAEIDNLMLELGQEELQQPDVQVIKTKPLGYIIIATAIIVSWALFLLAINSHYFI
ncbi:MAG: hypothetical protein FWC06_00850 [Treponema sp.]|nr:hypothetical protein [Treponema sp.]